MLNEIEISTCITINGLRLTVKWRDQNKKLLHGCSVTVPMEDEKDPAPEIAAALRVLADQVERIHRR